MMRRGRKQKCKHIQRDFTEYFFKPRGSKVRDLTIITISKEELEALRLVDREHLSQHEAALRMNTSSSTIQRMVEGARAKIVTAIVDGSAINIEGGNYTVTPKEEVFNA